MTGIGEADVPTAIDRIERRIFVVGAPRSGTTLVQSLLASHSDLTSFTESHFFSRHFWPLPLFSRPILVRDPRPRVREFLRENEAPDGLEAHSSLERGPASRLSPTLLPFATQKIARQLLSVLDDLARERARAAWIEKTPRHLHYLPYLEQLGEAGPRTDFVHVLRDGLEVVASLVVASRAWERGYDLESCVRRWNGDLGLSLRRQSSPRDHFVFYEEITRQPQATLERLLADLDLEPEPGLLERCGATAERLITRQETWKQGVTGPIRPSATSSSVLDDAQREWARRRLRHDAYERLRAECSGRRSGAC